MNCLAILTVFKFNPKKIKCDYSFIPVRKEGNGWRSEVSTEIYTNDGFKLLDNNLVKFEKIKKGKACKISLISAGELEDIEEKVTKKIYELFNKHFWYKFKYRNFLNKKRNLGQIQFF